MKNILVLCTGNSARSILAEALLNHLGRSRVRAYSAGSHPKGSPHPCAIELLQAKGLDAAIYRSKSWDEFSLPGAPNMDIVITVCDSAAGESCPIWPGVPLKAHWGIADPAAVEGEGQEAAFELAWQQLSQRVEAMLAMPIETMGADELRAALAKIGADSDGATELASQTARYGVGA